MNLFLLVAVPLAAVALHLSLHRERPPFSDPKAWILGFVWSMMALVAAALFGKWREFTGDLTGNFLGLTITDVLLVPGVVTAAWVLTRPRQPVWELGLWLAMVFAFAGIRDFAATSRIYDLTELFLVPLDRILLVLTLPVTVVAALAPQKVVPRVLWIAAAVALGLTGAVVPVLSYAGWGWLAWVLVVAGLSAAFWAQKRAVPRQDGPEFETNL